MFLYILHTYIHIKVFHGHNYKFLIIFLGTKTIISKPVLKYSNMLTEEDDFKKEIYKYIFQSISIIEVQNKITHTISKRKLFS